MILGKYNQAKTITFDLVAPDGVDLIINATFAAGDVVIMKDEGAEANTTNLPTDEGTGYSLVLTAAEMSAARIRVYIIDQTATKIWLDISVGVESYGNASAEHAFDLDTASTAQTADHTTAIADLPTNAEFNARSLPSATYFDPTADQVILLTATQASIDAIEADTNELQGDWVNGGRLDLILDATGTSVEIAALNDLSPAEVNLEMVDVMEVDTHAEPSGVVAATSSLKDMINWNKALGRNKMTQTSTTTLLRNDGDSGNIATSTVSDDTTTFTKGKFL